MRTPYVRAVGLLQEDDSGTRGAPAFSAEEEEELRAMAAEPGLYDRLWPSVAPAISGEYTNDIKKAVLCLLMGGSRKLLPDGTRLRGDINVLMLGDPSTAKSQFLKFVERVAPVGVYTSGKGSSAAGLTASGERPVPACSHGRAFRRARASSSQMRAISAQPAIAACNVLRRCSSSGPAADALSTPL